MTLRNVLVVFVVIVAFMILGHQKGEVSPTSAFGLSQDRFCDVVQSFIREYREAEQTGANEAGLSQLRYNRKQSLSAIMNHEKVTGWTGVVKSITTDRDGTGRLEAQLSCGTELRSDVELYSESGISQGTALYSTLISLTPGRRIVMSGTFEIENGTDYVGERSITEAGSMTNPEFDFRFDSFSPETDQDGSTAPVLASSPAEPATPSDEQPSTSSPAPVGVPSSVWDVGRSSALGADTASKRLPLPPDTSTDCSGPFFSEYQGTGEWGAVCQSQIATAHAALRNANLACDALVSEWRDEPAESPMTKLVCFIADDSAYRIISRVLRGRSRAVQEGHARSVASRFEVRQRSTYSARKSRVH